MKVLHLTAGKLYGGVETILTTLAKMHHEVPEMEPEFGLCFRGRLWDELESYGLQVQDLGQVRFSQPWTVMRARTRLANLLKTVPYDAVICHMSWIQCLFGGVARRYGPGFAAYFHSELKNSILDALSRRRKPALIIGPSRHTLNSYLPYFPGVRAEVFYAPIPVTLIESAELSIEERYQLRRDLGAAVEDVVIFTANRIETWKGPDRTLRALGSLKDIPGWKFWLAGGVQQPSEQDYFDSLQRIARELGISERVKFLGQRSDVARLMRAADCYCQGNRGPEGFSIAFLEASYCRLPIVTTDLGGAAEIVGSDNGVLVPPGEDVTRLSEALRSLIEDPGRRTAMGQRAREKAISICEPRQQLQKLSKLLRSACPSYP